MKLDGLKIFNQQLSNDLSSDSIAVNVYYQFNEKWYDLSTEDICSDAYIKDLEKSKDEPIAYHASSRSDAWFYLKDVKATVRLVFAQSPQIATRRKNREKIIKIQESASNAYKVSHNSLTQLLARDAFRKQLSGDIKKINTPPKMSATEVQENAVARTLAVLALDIDHFKQVNDTWGHLYGDQVLRAFGRRLEECAEKIRHTGDGNPCVYLGHPSGEEFLVAIHAAALRDQFIEWADEFRRAIADNLMPSESEWGWLSSNGGTGSLLPPPLQERVTTTSIGLALHDSALRSDTGIDVVSDLLDRADTALYRAKAAGRNQVIAFDDILSSCGRVLEQDLNTRVVSLDIGSNVGVTVGQEFKVFLPNFTGKAAFFLNDGRTKRTLGYYPRVESARVVVFNAQPEISFAYVASPAEATVTLDPGSHLEAIPAGSIGHLLPSFSKYFPLNSSSFAQGGLDGLQQFVESEAKNGSPFAVVIRFANDGEYLRKYGSVSLNSALAQLYREAQIAFHAAKAVEVIDRATICVVGKKDQYKEDVVKEFVEKIASDLVELDVVSGVFCHSDLDESSKSEWGQLNAENAIEFARFAASDAGRSSSRVRHFGYGVATSVLQALRETRSLNVAYADFQKLRKLGVESPGVYNLGALVAFSLGLLQEAVKLYAVAMNKDPSSLVYKGNFGIASYQVNDIEPALKIFDLLSWKELDRLLEVYKFGYLGYAALLARAKLNKSETYNDQKFAYVAPNAIKMAEYAQLPMMKVIKEALEMT